MPLMNQSQYARHRGITKQTVNRYFQSGFLGPALVFQPGRKKPLIDSTLADGILDSFLDPRFTKKLKPSVKDGSFLRARAEAEMYRAKLLKQKLDEKMEKYILRSEVQAQIEIAWKITEKVLGTIPARCAAKSEPKTEEDRKFIEKLLEKEVTAILRDLRTGLNKFYGPGNGTSEF